MSITVKQIAQALFQQSQGKKSKEVDILIDNAFKILAENNLLKYKDQLLPAVEQVRREVENKLLATVRSRNKLTTGQLKEIGDYVESKTGKTVELAEVLDEGIIGGAKVTYEDTELDLTINKKLKVLKQYLQTK